MNLVSLQRILGVLMLALLFALVTTPGTTWAQDDAPAETETTETVAEEAEETVSEAAAEVEDSDEEETEEAQEESDEEEADEVTPHDAPYNEQVWEDGWVLNTLFMFIFAVLVLFMQAGFAMLEVGLNSAKNTINILFKNVMDVSVGVLLYLLIGWGIMYSGSDNPYFDYAGPWVARDAQAVNGDNLSEGWKAVPNDSDGAPYASSASDFLFQVAFAATAATIVSGAVAGRMQFIGYLIYSAILTGIIYPISGYWKWGGGFLDQAGFQDFAGSVVVHAVGGFAGLAGAIVLGPRIGRFVDGKSVPLPGHNIAFAALGVFILWVGWYGFNPGSQLTYNGYINAEATSYIALTTTIAAAAGAVAAMVVGWALYSKPDVTMALNGVLAGLVSITANCDQVTQRDALIIGAIGGVLVVAGIVLLDKLRIDDPVGAWPVHGLCGVWGGIATGIFGLNLPEVDGEILTRGEYLSVQIYATVVICVWAFATMFILFSIMKAAGILRVSAEEEQAGLDISEHGMQAYGSH